VLHIGANDRWRTDAKAAHPAHIATCRAVPSMLMDINARPPAPT
jgi:hypothetical protein